MVTKYIKAYMDGYKTGTCVSDFLTEGMSKGETKIYMHGVKNALAKKNQDLQKLERIAQIRTEKETKAKEKSLDKSL